MKDQIKTFTELALDSIRASVDTFFSLEISDGRIFSEKGRDIKLEADLFLSKELSFRLKQSTGIDCLSEEDAKDRDLPESKPIWVIDPLDGSMNFSRGIPLYCISVALWQKNEPLVGIIYDLERRQAFTAFHGEAWMNDKAIHVGSICRLDRAILATGFPLLTELSQDSVTCFLDFARQFKKVRMVGSAALSMAWVAEGKIDAYFEKDIMLWDVAAGIALVNAAAGECIVHPGQYPMSRDVLAGNPMLVTQMRKVLKW